MREIMESLIAAETRFAEASDRILAGNQEIQKSQQKDYEHVVEYLRDSEKSAAKFWVACNQAMQKYLDSAAASMEAAGQATQKGEELVVSNQEIAKTFSDNLKEYSEVQDLTYKTMEKVRVLLSDISVAKGNQDVYLVGNSSRNEALERIEQLMTEQSEATQQVLTESSKTMRDMSKGTQRGKFGLFK